MMFLDGHFLPKLNRVSKGPHLWLAQLNYTLEPRFEIGMGVDLVGIYQSSILVRGMFKYLVVGEPFDRARPGANSVAIYAHPIIGRVNVSGNQDGNFGRGGYPWRANSNFNGLSGGVSYGYMKSDQSFFFVGGAYESYVVSALAHQDASTTGDFPAAEVSFPSTAGHSVTAALGYRFGVKNRVSFVYSYSENSWQNFKDRQYHFSFGFGLVDFLKPMAPLQPVGL